MTKETMITLIAAIPDGSDDEGNPIYVEERFEIFAVIKGVKRSEFYSAMSAGLKPEITFEIFEPEYRGQKIVEYTDVCGELHRLSVIRSYPVKGERLELICTDTAEVS